MPRQAPPPLGEPDVVGAYQQQTTALRDQVAEAVAQAWIALGAYRTVNIAAFLRDVLPIILAGQRQMSELTVGYLTAHRATQLGRTVPLRIDPRTVSGAPARGGVTPRDVYERPFHLVWRQLATLPHIDGAIEQAIKSGQDRAVQSAVTDMQLAKVQTSQAALKQDPKVTGYRRVLEGAHSCALCIVAATQRYHRAQLLPIHPGCDCAVEPLYTRDGGGPVEAVVRADAGNLIPVTDLPGIHDRIEQAFGTASNASRRIGRGLPNYRDVLVAHDHGELGPVLAVKGRPFTSSGDIPTPPHHHSAGNGGGGGGQPPAPKPSPSQPERRPSVDETIPRSDAPDEIQRATEALRRVVAGQYGPLVVQPPSLDVDAGAGKDNNLWTAEITTPSGGHAGWVERTYARDPDGLFVYHDLLALEPDWRRKGFGKAFSEHLEDWYRESGVTKIHLLAALDDGGYTWAVAGYDWDGPEAPNGPDDDHGVIPRLRAAIDAGNGTPEELDAARALLDRFINTPFSAQGYPTPQEVASIGRGEGRRTWLGQRVLRGSQWHGVKDLT